MNCDQFSERMHQRLDDRRSLDADGELLRHADACDSCAAELHAWRQIASIMPNSAGNVRPNVTRPYSFPVVSAVAALAAVILFALIVVVSDQDSSQASVDSVKVVDDPMVLAQTSAELDPARWWRDVQDRDWVGQTMPTVRSVQRSVAPIGRSLMRAVTILTIGAREQTS